MNAQDAQAQADTIEYYRLVMVAHQKDPYTPETARTDAEVLEMVKQNPDIIEMNKQFMDGGYAFRTARAMSVDGANSSAANHDALAEETIANLYRKRAELLANSTDYDELYAIGTKMDGEDEPIKNAHNRLQMAFTNAIDFLFQLAATKDGDSRGDGKKSSLEQALTEINELAPGKRFPDLFKVPMLRQRTCYSDEKLERIVSLFEEINRERFQGRF
jgi:hypothetical protein